ncbi:MAG: sulfotransferase family protein [Acidithiobacillus sp.]
MPEIAPSTHRYHFISGLPRSGSTLLAAILSQNPRFLAGMSSPVAGLVHTLLHEMSGQNEFSVFIDNAQRQRILRGVVEHYYTATSAEVVFDTNRSWCSKLPLLATLFPDSKVIACVRDLSWIIDSVERLVRKNAFEPSSIFNYQSGGTVYTRANGLAGPEGLVGYAYDALKEAYYGEQAEGHLILVSYESLVPRPEETLQALYTLLEEPGYAHDPERVCFDAKAYDRKTGTPGLHRIRPRVEAVERATILPPELFQRFRGDAFWKDPSRARKDIPVL